MVHSIKCKKTQAVIAGRSAGKVACSCKPSVAADDPVRERAALRSIENDLRKEREAR